MKRTVIGLITLLLVSAVAGVVYWSSRVTEHSEFTWYNKAEQARICYSTSGADQELGVARSAMQALDIVADEGWRVVSTEPGEFGTKYTVVRTGLKRPGRLMLHFTLRK
jgi:hypothetical protein